MAKHHISTEPPSTKIKTYFITGLVLLLPLALTVAIVMFAINLLTEPFVGIVKAVLGYYNLFQSGFLFLSADQVQKILSKIIILVLLFFFTVGLGVLTRWFFLHYLIRFWEYVVAKIPFISGVYKTTQEVIKTLFAGSANAFKQVVLVPFPMKETMTIGFVTRDDIPSPADASTLLTAVFVPTTPNPTSGFLMLYKKDSITHLDMKVEDALKYVISCGVIHTPLSVQNKGLRKE